MDKYQIAANVVLNELEGFTGKMPAKLQRSVFGRALFGKKTVKIDATNQGTIKAKSLICFGQDAQVAEFSFEQVACYANNPQIQVRF